jgi:hypothetical protein
MPSRVVMVSNIGYEGPCAAAIAAIHGLNPLIEVSHFYFS